MTFDIFLQNSLSFSGFNAIIEIQRYATKSILFVHHKKRRGVEPFTGNFLRIVYDFNN